VGLSISSGFFVVAGLRDLLVFAVVFEGCFGKSGELVWCFCGEVVVECWVKMVD
jgi:hypothetical protein